MAEVDGGSGVDAIFSVTVIVAIVVGAAVWALFYTVRDGKRGESSTLTEGTTDGPPSAPLAYEFPILGHALSYKHDPPAFLLANAAASGGVFSLNLAGFRTTMVSDTVAMRAVAVAPPSVLSLRHAVADFGFNDALGPLNVFLGSDVHRLVLKGELYPLLGRDASPLVRATQVAVDTYLPLGVASTVDLLPTVRRVLLHASVTLFIGDAVLEQAPDFIEQYVRFQDNLEEAIAKAVVLPKWLARPLHLASVKADRLALVQLLAGPIQQMWARGSGAGSWTAAIRKMDRATLSGFRDLVQMHPSSPSCESSVAPFTADEAAELVIGLLFASHKNPGIGAAQTLLFLLDPQNQTAATLAVDEVRTASADDNVDQTPPRRTDAEVLAATPRLNACVLEALRLCSHSIGAVRKVVAPTGFLLPTAAGKSYTLPKGAYIGISHIVPHLDRVGWGAAADEFRPYEHFVDSNPPNDFKFTAFSHGLHRCPGRSLAMLQMQAALSTLLLRFDVTPTAPIPPLCFAKATLAQRAGPCMVSFRPRVMSAAE
jgi:cytochrome P450